MDSSDDNVTRKLRFPNKPSPAFKYAFVWHRLDLTALK
jgi:hypothetical protein